MRMLKDNFVEALQKYCDAILVDYQNWCDKAQIINNRNDKVMSYELGSKYARVVQASVNGMHRSVHSFIVLKDSNKWKVGDILKAATWKAPAQNFKRGNILDSETYKNVRWTGC